VPLPVPPGYPIVLDLAGRRVVVVGAGPVASRKVTGLLASEASITIVAPEVLPGLAALGEAGRATLLQRSYQRGDLDGAALAFAAAPPAVNRQVAADAAAAGVLVSVADDRHASGFSTPATLRRGGLLLAVATGGAAPGLAGALRRRLGASFGPEWSGLVELLGRHRQRLPAAADSGAWDTILDGSLQALLLAGDLAGAERLLDRMLGQVAEARDTPGGG
jgi:precorrin-2 dehydrogenase/sirohydrochlorin ferrochelatase